MMRTPLASTLAALLAGFAGGTAALAQMQLPGAVSGHAPITSGGERTATGVAVRAPVETSLVGRDLRLNGVHGIINFQKQGDSLAIARLVLSGERLSNRREACRVEVEGGPFAASAQGRAEGLKRFSIRIPACPFSFVVLESAILATVEGAAPVQPAAATRPDNRAGNTVGMCAFTQADCVVHIGGVWGPAGSSISKGDIDQIVKARTAAEKNALANYRALISQAGKDRNKVRAIAADQASFSSKRAEQCYDYDGEEVHGFCSARLTEARAVALRAQLNPSAFEAENNAPERKPAAPRPRPQAQGQPPQPGQPPPGAPMPLGR
ncbi:MAG: hypothetical protein ACK4MV_10340 [Beijerinckiaceae bacterium]